MDLAHRMEPSDLAWAALAVSKAAERFPRICPNGRNWYYPDRTEGWGDEDYAMVCLCRVYFMRAKVIKTPSYGSYGLKHCIENHFTVEGRKSYVHNGACIVAAMALGFPVKPSPHNDLNCRIGISINSVRELGAYTEEIAKFAASR